MLYVSDNHGKLIRVITDIVEDAALRAMCSPGTVEKRTDYVNTRAREAADLTQHVAKEVAETMNRLIREGNFSRLPLQDQPALSGSPIHWPLQLSSQQKATQAADESTR